MLYYDVIVVGAGPAGSTTAYLLAKFGLNVLLVDKAKFPRPKLCGGLLTFKTYKLVSRIFDFSEDQFKNLINFSCNSFKLYYKNKLLFIGKLDNPFYLVERDKYDFFFLKLAQEQGVDILEGEKVIDFDPFSNEIRTSSQKLKGKFIVGADGVNSLIRKKFPSFDRKKWYRNLAIAIEIFLEDLNLKEIYMYLGFIDIGYGWIFPNKNRTIIGLGGLLKDKRSNFLDKFKYFLANLRCKNPDNIKGHLVPYGNFLKKPIYKNTLLVGDAAGFVDPLLGEGIFYAHRSGEIAAYSIYYSLKKDCNLANTYVNLLKKYIYPPLKSAQKVRRLFFRTSPIWPYFPFRLFSQNFQSYLVDIIHGLRLYNFRKWQRCCEFLSL